MMKAKVLTMDTNKQEISENIPGFALSCYLSEFFSDTYDYIDWHWHVEFQLCIVTKGTMVWKIGSRQFRLRCGDGIFINSQQIHMAKPFRYDEAAFFCVDVRPDFICGDKNSPTYVKQILPILQDEKLEIKQLSADIDAEKQILDRLSDMADSFANKQAGYELELVGNMFLIWKKLFPLLPINFDSNQTTSTTRLKEILMFLHKNYSYQLTLDEIAANINLSRSECCRYFKGQTGQTVFEYLIQYRINKSLDLLSHTNMSIAQIAVEVGFANQSYYTNRFRKIMGLTPKEFRRERTTKREYASNSRETK